MSLSPACVVAGMVVGMVVADTLLLAKIASFTRRTVLIGMAKFRSPCDAPRVLMPTILALRSTSGPPLLPGAMGASICTQLEKLPVS